MGQTVSQHVQPFGPIFIQVFLATFELTCSAHHICHSQAMWVMPSTMFGGVAASFNWWMIENDNCVGKPISVDNRKTLKGPVWGHNCTRRTNYWSVTETIKLSQNIYSLNAQSPQPWRHSTTTKIFLLNSLEKERCTTKPTWIIY